MWGGKSWERIVRFQHPNVKLLDFCPNDEYLVSWSPEKENEDPEVFSLLILFSFFLEFACLGYQNWKIITKI